MAGQYARRSAVVCTVPAALSHSELWQPRHSRQWIGAKQFLLLMFVSSGNKIDNAILGCHDKQFIIGPFFDKGRSGIWVDGWLWLKCLVWVGRQVRAYTHVPTSHYISLSNSTNSIITESI